MSAATMLKHAPLEAVSIYFDTATYDEIQRDVKVQLFSYILIICALTSGDLGGPIRAHWRHNGPSHWILHTQWR